LLFKEYLIKFCLVIVIVAWRHLLIECAVGKVIIIEFVVRRLIYVTTVGHKIATPSEML